MKNLLSIIIVGALFGCSKSASENPQAAVAQMEQAFAGSDTATKQNVTAVSDAMRKGEYDQAVVSLNMIRSQPAATPEQHEALQKTSVALESQLIRAMESGDEKAKASYQLLKEMRRN